MADTVEDEKLPSESVTTSWIELDSKNGTSSSNGEDYPQDSDNDRYEENMTEALADASRSLYSSTTSSGNREEQNLVRTDESSSDVQHKSGSCRTNLAYISALLLSHSIAFIAGLLIGRKSLKS